MHQYLVKISFSNPLTSNVIAVGGCTGTATVDVGSQVVNLLAVLVSYD